MEDELCLKKLRVTYRSVTLPVILVAVLALVTVLVVLSNIIKDGGLCLPQQQLGWICFAIEAVILTCIHRAYLMFLYGFRGKEWSGARHCRLYAGVILMLIVVEATGIIAMTDGFYLYNRLRLGALVITWWMPFRSPMEELMVPMLFSVTMGWSAWSCLAHIADLRNHEKASLKSQQGEYLDFKQYVRMAAKYAKK